VPVPSILLPSPSTQTQTQHINRRPETATRQTSAGRFEGSGIRGVALSINRVSLLQAVRIGSSDSVVTLLVSELRFWLDCESRESRDPLAPGRQSLDCRSI
jgi:hypothetical protein